jgi:hypothetical protein
MWTSKSAIFLALIVAACGGTASDSQKQEIAMCSATPCGGGSLVGTWTLDTSCVTTYTSSCATYDDSKVTTTGMIVFGADGTFALQVARTGDEIQSTPLHGACGSLSTCPTCTGTPVAGSDSSQCECEVPVSPTPWVQHGKYVASDAGSITMIFQADGVPWNASYDFCARGDTLVLNDWAGSELNAVYRRQ